MKFKNLTLKEFLIIACPIWFNCFCIGTLEFPLKIIGFIGSIFVGSFFIISLMLLKGEFDLINIFNNKVDR